MTHFLSTALFIAVGGIALYWLVATIRADLPLILKALGWAPTVSTPAHPPARAERSSAVSTETFPDARVSELELHLPGDVA